VYDSNGRRVDQGNTHIDPADALSLSVALNAPLPDGVYTVAWRVLSSVDGHATQGVFAFAVGTSAGGVAMPAPSQTAPQAPDVLAAEAFARWLNLLAAAIAVGGLVFLLAIWWPAWRGALPGVDLAAIPGSLGRLAQRALTLLLLALLVLLVVQAAVAAGGALRDGLDAARIVRLVTAGRFGAIWLARLVLALALLALGVPVPGQPGARVHAWVSIALGVLPVLNDWLHLTAASVWLGGLVYLAISLPVAYRALGAIERTRLAAETVSRFSVLGLICVSLLMATGLIQGSLNVVGNDLGAYFRPDGPLFTTDYGRTLLVKLLLILPLVATAGVNLLFVGPRLREGVRKAADAVSARRALLVTVRVEIALLLAVLAAVGLLTSLAPALQPASQAQDVVSTFTGRADNLDVTLTIAPGGVGTRTFGVQLRDANGVAYDVAKEVDLRFQPLDVSNMGSAGTALEAHGGGHYAASGSFLSLNGRWRIEVAVRRPDAFDAFANFDVDVTAMGVRAVAAQPPALQVRWPLVTGALIVVAALLAGLVVWRYAPRRAGLGPALGALCVVLIAVPGIATVYQGLQTPANEIVNPLAGDPAAIAAGQVIYGQDCATCHGSNGRGDGPAALTLNPRPSDFCIHMQPGTHTDAEVFAWISNGYPGSAMRGWSGVLSETQRWQVYAYLKAQFGRMDCAGTPTPAATP
jgi:copper transport protein